MATWNNIDVAQAQAALDKLSDLETAAMKAGDLASVNALQGDCDDLTLKLTQLRALAVQADDDQVAALNAQLDAVTAKAKAAMDDVSQLTSVLTNILTVTKMLDGIIAFAAKA